MEIFVFGSNLLGIHGKGAALYAKQNYGAVQGCGLGRTGNSYAIATKKRPTMHPQDVMPLGAIEFQVRCFLLYAEENMQHTYLVTRVGCGLAGYKDEQIAPMFRAAPKCCKLPDEWSQIL